MPWFPPPISINIKAINCILIFLDVSSALDTTDHSVLSYFHAQLLALKTNEQGTTTLEHMKVRSRLTGSMAYEEGKGGDSPSVAACSGCWGISLHIVASH